jgi:hypothetical protein
MAEGWINQRFGNRSYLVRREIYLDDKYRYYSTDFALFAAKPRDVAARLWGFYWIYTMCLQNKFATNLRVNINWVRNVGNTYFSFKSCRLNAPQNVHVHYLDLKKSNKCRNLMKQRIYCGCSKKSLSAPRSNEHLSKKAVHAVADFLNCWRRGFKFTCETPWNFQAFSQIPGPLKTICVPRNSINPPLFWAPQSWEILLLCALLHT